MKTLICMSLLFALVSLEFAPSQASGARQKESASGKQLRLTGEVLKAEKISEDVSQIGVKTSLRLTFSNVGNEPIIIVFYQKRLWLGAVEIARSVEDAAIKYLYRDSAWPNNWGRSDRLKLRTILDQPYPPPDTTLVLKPGESWQYETVAWMGFDKEESYDREKKAWSEIRHHNPLLLLVTLEMWPVNAEPRLDRKNPKWGRELRTRWKGKGLLWLDDLTSEPIKLDLSQISSLRSE